MPEKYLYEYAIIRFLPRVEREEFMNIGVILFSKRARFIKTIYQLNEEKLQCFSSELDIDSLRESLNAFDKICSGEEEGGLIATLELPDRFRWLTAIRSTSLQTSRARTGFTFDPQKTLERLFEEFVL
ncbi:hypothetical protein M2137_000006 [Parabacteroides sp. PFB2-10]|uniref:DUF3037 domain-containing protein n=1 Tax=Parabacteroides sp. PFB2-10 TaxID=1742405 RepID=UPI0024733A77|nr:DUF3037 domain-containing protein [Parabacteroides sp. PFB2-10]MDH6311256.1 hypothetical protein [Parabacteroides sp. PFB2-10]MDL2245855.1 DUF3037 domain-containing protein [Parabacteroides sp. OttesenSCG-928-J18]